MTDATETPELRLEVTTETGETTTTVVRVAGEIDVSNVMPLESALELALDPGGETVVDLAGVSFIDSTAIAALIRASNGLRRLGGRLRLRNAREEVRRVIDLLSLADQLGLED